MTGLQGCGNTWTLTVIMFGSPGGLQFPKNKKKREKNPLKIQQIQAACAGTDSG